MGQHTHMLSSSGLSEKKGTRSASLAAHSVACGRVVANPYPNQDPVSQGVTIPSLDQRGFPDQSYSNDLPRNYPDDVEDPVPITEMDTSMLWWIIGGVSLVVLLCGGGLCYHCYKRKDKTPKIPRESSATGNEPPPRQQQLEVPPPPSEDRSQEQRRQVPSFSPEEVSAFKMIKNMIRTPDNDPVVLVGNKKIKADIQGLFREKKNADALPGLLTGSASKKPTGILLYGPSGCGKSTIATWMSQMEDVTLFDVKPSALVGSTWTQTVNNVETLFKFAASKPCSVLFIDEIDLCLGKRERDETKDDKAIKQAILTQMDCPITQDNNKGVFVLGATNCPQDVDEAIIRRMQHMHFLDVPDQSQRVEMFQNIKTNNEDFFKKINEKDLKKFAQNKQLADFTYSNIEDLVTHATRQVVEEALKDKNGKAQDTSKLSDAEWKELVKKNEKPMEIKHLSIGLRKSSKSNTANVLALIKGWEKVARAKVK